MLYVIYAHQSLTKLAQASEGLAPMDVDKSTDDFPTKLRTLFRMNTDMTNGLSLEFIQRELSEYASGEIKKKVEFMIAEGHIYTTTTDEVYQLT